MDQFINNVYFKASTNTSAPKPFSSVSAPPHDPHQRKAPLSPVAPPSYNAPSSTAPAFSPTLSAGKCPYYNSYYDKIVTVKDHRIMNWIRAQQLTGSMEFLH